MKYKASKPDGAETITADAVIVCAGRGERTGLAYNKILYNIGRKTVIEYVLDAFALSCVRNTVLVSSPDDFERLSEIAAGYERVSVCVGGQTRAQSVKRGLAAINGCDIAVIHDGARPNVTARMIDESVRSAASCGSGIAAVPSVDSVKQKSGDTVRALPRSALYNAQTPQTFRYAEIVNAYDTVSGEFTDDAEVYERAGYAPRLIDGDYSNTKITSPADLIRGVPEHTRIGIGFDVHRLVEGRPLILGGIEIPFEKGLDGHSDADVLTHAVMDALLSAADCPDIGVLFPDSDDATRGISSMTLLDGVLDRLSERGASIINISAVIMAQRPKLAGIIPAMRDSLAAHLGIARDRINISATTTEHLGLIGNGDAIAASASCLLTIYNDK